MSLKDKIKKSAFIAVFRQISKKPQLLLYMLLADLLFVFSFYLLNLLTNSTIGKNQYQLLSILRTGLAVTGFILFFALAYLLIVIFIYSFFKYATLHFIKLFFEKIKFGLNRLKNFYFLNLRVYASFFMIFAVFMLILLAVKQTYAKFIFLLFLVPFLFFVYSFVNVSHSLFSEENKSKGNMRKSLRITFKRIPSYLGIYLLDITALFLYFLIYFIVGFIIVKVIGVNVNIKVYDTIFIIITFIIFYLIFVYNRIYFYLVVKNNIRK